MQQLKAAVENGADTVYLGGRRYESRKQGALNLSKIIEDELKKYKTKLIPYLPNVTKGQYDAYIEKIKSFSW